jgi:hypothetical protein
VIFYCKVPLLLTNPVMVLREAREESTLNIKKVKNGSGPGYRYCFLLYVFYSH